MALPGRSMTIPRGAVSRTTESRDADTFSSRSAFLFEKEGRGRWDTYVRARYPQNGRGPR